MRSDDNKGGSSSPAGTVDAGIKDGLVSVATVRWK